MERSTFERIYDTHFRRVYNYISYRINDHTHVEDLVSTVFLRVIAKYGLYDPNKGPLEGWIIGIARNAVTDYYRERVGASTVDLNAFADGLKWDGDAPDEIVVRREEQRALMKALNTLGDRERQIISLKYGAELSNRQIARQMDLSVSNVGVILFRSLARLRKILGKEESS